MVSAAYIVRPGRCALGPLEPDDEELARQAAGEAPAPEDLFVLELHRGERPRLRRTRSIDEVGICLEHWRQAIQGITETVIELVAQEDPEAAEELERRLLAQRGLQGAPDAELTAGELGAIAQSELQVRTWINTLAPEDRPQLSDGALRVLAWIRWLPLVEVQLVAAGRLGPPLELAPLAQRLTGEELAICVGELTVRAIDVQRRLERVIAIATSQEKPVRPRRRRSRGFPMT